LQTDSSLFYIGLGIGLGLALIGALIDTWLGWRDQTLERARKVPGCMVYMGGLLGLAGIVALIVSFLTSGSLGPALLLGAGVLGGFYAGFTLLIVLYLLLKLLGTSVRR